MRHQHTAKCVRKETVIEAPYGVKGIRVPVEYTRSNHGTPTAIPRRLGKRRYGRDVQFCATHHAWEPKAMAQSTEHR